ncbi:MAG: hypothetical protein GY851_10490 [bacterium]|nr:hypothetical protein [bacterium]
MPHRRNAFLLTSFVLLIAAAPWVEAAEAAFPVPINVAEAIIEPFWDPGLSALDQWNVDDGRAHGLHVSQGWAAVDFEWAQRPNSGPALAMSRTVRVDCSDYDRFMVRIALPKQAMFEIVLATDLGERAKRFPPHEGAEEEYALDLDGAKIIESIRFTINAGAEGVGVGWFRWVGLQNTTMLAQHTRRWDYSGMMWDRYIQGNDFEPEFKPLYGIFVTNDELESMRASHEASMRDSGESTYTKTAESAHDMDFESAIGEFARSRGNHQRYNRVREADMASMPGNRSLAVAGLVLKDADALRAAARYALSLAMCEHWREGFITHFPGGAWEHRSFRASGVAEEVAYVLDVAGEILTEGGRAYLRRRLAEEGCGGINFVTWRHDYIFHCNQLAYFNTGRMYAYAVLEREWPRVKPYTDLAMRDSVENLELALFPDGSCGEGPSYFTPTVRENYEVLKCYARARGLALEDITPDVLKRSSDFAALLMSTTDTHVIPICDASARFGRGILDILVHLMPGSHWTTMCNKQRRKNGETLLEPAGPPVPAFVQLPHMGPMASTRMIGDLPVKILVMGHNSRSGHTHEDKGGFVLEFAGETFALDLGTCSYSDPIHHQYGQCQRHNMLVPVGMTERAHPECPLPVDVKPEGRGDDTAFSATIDATAGWDGYYTKWTRSWDSPAPEVLTIRDDYALAKGDGVEFYWQTRLPVQIDGAGITIEGDRGKVILSVPEECTVRVDTLPMHGDESHSRIVVRKLGTRGTLEIAVRLVPR